jgi:hypothetical protein
MDLSIVFYNSRTEIVERTWSRIVPVDRNPGLVPIVSEDGLMRFT